MPRPPSPRWGSRFEPLPSSPEAPPSDLSSPTHSQPQSEIIDDYDKDTSVTGNRQTHNPSIFVGSLPTNVDLRHLQTLLLAHLSEHGNVENIKAIRDSKGGVCAFVQCKDANDAAQLLSHLKSTHVQPFLGRVLRFEPARAFRTVLISYRKPQSGSTLEKGDPGSPALTLHALRISRSKNTKYHEVSYNSRAINVLPDKDSCEEDFLLLNPLNYDERTIHALASYFGPLESFTRRGEHLQGGNDSDDHQNSYSSLPFPHDAFRLSFMDLGCFEVKWKRREDCVSALATLRQVSFLTVTWAHHPPRYPRQKGGVHPAYQAYIEHPTEMFQSSGCKNGGTHELREAGHRGLGVTSPRASVAQKFSCHGFHYERASDHTGGERMVTPPLVHSPTTPKTPNTQPPLTPICGNDLMYPLNSQGNEQMVDPNTVFVGGLEAATWNTDKLRVIFSQYGNILDVNLIQTQHNKANFAFVQFDNTMSAKKAILEQHNHPYDGRPIRVQLRNTWNRSERHRFGRPATRGSPHSPVYAPTVPGKGLIRSGEMDPTFTQKTSVHDNVQGGSDTPPTTASLHSASPVPPTRELNTAYEGASFGQTSNNPPVQPPWNPLIHSFLPPTGPLYTGYLPQQANTEVGLPPPGYPPYWHLPMSNMPYFAAHPQDDQTLLPQPMEAPLQPKGLYMSHHGVLVAVYQPEDLQKYRNSQGAQTLVSSEATATVPSQTSAPPQGPPVQGATPNVGVPPPYMYGPPLLAPYPPHNAGWGPLQPMYAPQGTIPGSSGHGYPYNAWTSGPQRRKDFGHNRFQRRPALPFPTGALSGPPPANNMPSPVAASPIRTE